MLRTTLITTTAILVTSACVVDDDIGYAGLEIDEAGLLAFMNDQESTTLERLDIDCAIRSDSARNLIAHRDGNDRTPFTADDDLFDSAAEIDDVRMVGPWTMDRLQACADRYTSADGSWTTLLDVSGGAPSRVAVAGLDSGDGAVFHRDIVFAASGNYSVSYFRNYQGGLWQAPLRLDTNFPTFPSSYGPEVKGAFDHYLVAMPESTGSVYVAGVLTRYSTSSLNADGLLYAFFLRSFDGEEWGPWHRVTPVGSISNVATCVDATGRVWFGWKSATNLEPGDVHLSWFDPSSAEVGPVETVATATQMGGFHQVDVVCQEGGELWLTYAGASGIEARRRDSSGSWDEAIPVTTTFAGYHDSVFTDDSLYVAVEQNGVTVHRLTDSGFVADTNFAASAYEEGDELESLDYAAPALALSPEGNLTVAMARYHHYESATSDFDEADTLISERSDSWSPLTVVYEGGAWNNVGGSMAATADALWIAGDAHNATLFVVRRQVADNQGEQQSN